MDWDRFSFEYVYSFANLFSPLVEIQAYKEAAVNLVLLSSWKDKLDRLNRVRAVYGTTALEGNPLSESEVSHQIDLSERKKESDEKKATKEQMQIRNASIAQNWVKLRFTPDNRPIGVSDILHIHRLITADSDTTNNEPGKLRAFSVTVGSPSMGGVHKGAPAERLPELMEEYVRFINSRRLAEEHPVIRALLAHFFLVTIHPFGDGNGRVSRLVEGGILYQQQHNVHGFYGLSNYFYKNEQEYKSLLQKCRHICPFKMDSFIEFGVKGFATELKGINNFVKSKLNRIVYRDMLVRAFNKRIGERRRLLNNREYKLLDFLLSETEPSDPFSENPSKKLLFAELREAKYIQSAYGKVTPRTFYRELIRLGELGFINFQRDEAANDRFVELDFAAIGKY
jgi:Fic family protein